MPVPGRPDWVKRVVASEAQIQARITAVAAEINADYKGIVSDHSPLVLVGVLKGSFVFMADLARALGDLGLPTLCEFMCVSSYGGGMASVGEVRMLLDLRTPIRGKHVLMVEDIVDTARTLDFLMKLFNTRSPLSLKMVTLLDKKAGRVVPFRVEYVLFDCAEFVVGYGLDYDEKLRDLRDVVEFDEPKYKAQVQRSKDKAARIAAAQTVPPPSKL
jgi:hypoxanthine phosphoribosyltransferase